MSSDNKKRSMQIVLLTPSDAHVTSQQTVEFRKAQSNWSKEQDQEIIEGGLVGRRWSEVAQRVNAVGAQSPIPSQSQSQISSQSETPPQPQTNHSRQIMPDTEVRDGPQARKSAKQCAQRFARVLNPNIKKGVWSAEEDRILEDGVRSFGDCAWVKVARLLGDRTDIQCRTRWLFRMAQVNKHHISPRFVPADDPLPRPPRLPKLTARAFSPPFVDSAAQPGKSSEHPPPAQKADESATRQKRKHSIDYLLN